MFSEYHWPVYDAVCARDREPEVCLRAGHHKLEVIRRLAGGLRSCPRYAGDASVLNAATTAFFDLHLQLQVEVARFVAAIDDVVVALWLTLQCFAHHDAVFDAPDGGVGVPPGETLAVEDLLVARVLVNVIWRGVMKLRHTNELLAVWTHLGRPRSGRLQRRRHGLSEERGRERQEKDTQCGCLQNGLTNKARVGAIRSGHGVSCLPNLLHLSQRWQVGV